MWILGSARVGQHLERWWQGPYVDAEVSEEIVLDLPAEFAQDVARDHGAAVLTARIVAATIEGDTLGTWSLPALVWDLDAGPDEPQLVPMAQWPWSSDEHGDANADI